MHRRIIYLLCVGRTLVHLSCIFLPLSLEMVWTVSMTLAMHVDMISLRLQVSTGTYIQYVTSTVKPQTLNLHTKP